MDLNLTPQEQAFRDEVRAWFAANVPKDWVKRRNAEESMEARFAYLRAWQRKLYDAGWAGISWPKEYGGRGASLMEQVIFIEEMARAEAPPMANVLGLGLIGPTIIAFGTEAQKKRYLQQNPERRRDLVPGIFGAERGQRSGGAFDRSETRRRSSSSSTGTSAGTVTAGRPTGASWWCAPIRQSEKHKGLTVLLVDMKSPGVEVRGLKQMSGESEFCEIFFRDVRVPAENVVGKVNEGWRSPWAR